MLASKTTVATRPSVASRRSAVAVRADGAFIGSTTNVIMVASTGLCLAASRFGLAPSVRKNTSPTQPLKLVEKETTLVSGDPAGFTIVDVLAMGSAGHAIGAGIVLGLKGIGQL